MERIPAILAALVLIGGPLVASTSVADGADDNATWGLCQADENNEQGDNSSNGTIEETPPFENLSDSDCENASAPWEGTPGEDHAPNGTPGPGDNPGDGGDDGGDGDDHPDEDDNPGDDQGNESERP